MKKRLFLIPLSLLAAVGISAFAACGKDKGPAENKISFEIDVDGYTGTGVAGKTVETGESFTFPAAPSIEYYEFDYWLLGEKKYSVGDSYTIEKDGDLKFTAVYAETYVVSYTVANGLTVPTSQSGRVSSGEIELAEGVDNGYSLFVNWVIGGKTYASKSKYTPVHGLNTATAVYSDTYVVSFEVDEGLKAPGDESGKVGVDKVTLPEAPEKADYDFEGWLIDGELYAAGDEYEPGLGVTIAKAKYKLAYVYVTFEIKEKSGLEGELGNPLRIAVDTKLSASQIPELTAPEHYTYAWYIDNVEVAVEDLLDLEVSKNTTIVAKAVYLGVDNADELASSGALLFIESDDGYEVMAGENFASYYTDGIVYLPVSYNEKPIVGIKGGSASENAFGGAAAAGLKRIYIPATVTKIGAYAFYQNTSLKEVIYAEGTALETIDNYSFYYAYNLSTISYSTVAEGFYFPATVKTIGNGSFRGVSQNTREVNIYFDAENGVLESIGNDAFRSDGTTTAKISGFVLNTAFPSTLKTIGTYAFHCNPIIGRVDFGKNASITTISDYAFGQHTLTSNLITYTLTELVIPKSVTSIGKNAFQNNQALAYVEFEEGSQVTVIREYTFNMSYSLEEIILPAGLTTIETHAFSSSFKNSNEGAGISLNGADGKFVLPASVTEIGSFVFAGSVFNVVVIPNTVTKIGASAFGTTGSDYCTIKSLSFANGGSEGLEIGDKAFNSQNIQADLVISARVTSIGAYAFWKANITSLSFEEGTLDLAIGENAFNALGEAPGASLSSGKTLYPFSATSVTIPARTVSIGKNAFNGQLYLKEVKFADGCKITSIPDYAFAYCSKLESIDIPASVTSIGQYAYTIYSLAGIKSTVYVDGVAQTTTHTVADMYIDIEKITIPANVELISSNAFYSRGLKLKTLEFLGTAANNDLVIEGQSFKILPAYATALDPENGGNVTLTSVKFPANLVSVAGLFMNGSGYNATCAYNAIESIDLSACTRLTTLGDSFMAQTNLKAISIPATVTSIGSYAFSNQIVQNGDVTATMQFSGKVTLPAGLQSLGLYAFGAVNVTEFEIAGSNEVYKTVDGVIFTKDGTKLVNYPFGKTTTSYKVPDGCTTIAEGAFKSNPNLTSIDFNNVTTIEGTYTFAKTKITALDHTFEKVGNYTFFNTALITAVIDITGTTVPTNLFQNSADLVSVTLGEHISALGANAFMSCTNLATVTINGTLTNVGNNAFSACKALVSINLSDVTTLGTNVFQNASSLETVTLGAITTIGVNVFGGTALKSLTLKGDAVVTLGNVSAFTGVSGAKVYVKGSLIEGYQAAANWSKLVTDGAIVFEAIPGTEVTPDEGDGEGEGDGEDEGDEDGGEEEGEGGGTSGNEGGTEGGGAQDDTVVQD